MTERTKMRSGQRQAWSRHLSQVRAENGVSWERIAAALDCSETLVKKKFAEGTLTPDELVDVARLLRPAVLAPAVAQVGYRMVPDLTPGSVKPTDLVREGAELGMAAGTAVASYLEAVSDGVVTPSERRRVTASMQAVRIELADVEAGLDAATMADPQTEMRL